MTVSVKDGDTVDRFCYDRYVCHVKFRARARARARVVRSVFCVVVRLFVSTPVTSLQCYSRTDQCVVSSSVSQQATALHSRRFRFRALQRLRFASTSSLCVCCRFVGRRRVATLAFVYYSFCTIDTFTASFRCFTSSDSFTVTIITDHVTVSAIVVHHVSGVSSARRHVRHSGVTRGRPSRAPRAVGYVGRCCVLARDRVTLSHFATAGLKTACTVRTAGGGDERAGLDDNRETMAMGGRDDEGAGGWRPRRVHDEKARAKRVEAEEEGPGQRRGGGPAGKSPSPSYPGPPPSTPGTGPNKRLPAHPMYGNIAND